MSVESFAKKIIAGDRSALSRAITLMESARADDRSLADSILVKCMPHTGQAVRLAITGAPGAGKSTLIEALGLHAIAQDESVGVLAVDPSSIRTSGSILGDKTRMAGLSVHDLAFVRPSPSAGSLGGIRRATRDAMLLCEAAGFSVVIVETVGAGQSEFAVRNIVDLVIVLVLPNAGDELQGLKRGILESADIVVVTKADQDTHKAAEKTLRQYRRALAASPTSPSGIPVLACSALKRRGIAELWACVKTKVDALSSTGELKHYRNQQFINVIMEASKIALIDKLIEYSETTKLLSDLQDDVETGRASVSTATHTLISSFLRDCERNAP